jgi:hypothetical protein
MAATTDRSIYWRHGASKCIWWQPWGHKIRLVAFMWLLDLFGGHVTAKSTWRPPLGRHKRAAAASQLFICKELYSLYLSIHVINTLELQRNAKYSNIFFYNLVPN